MFPGFAPFGIGGFGQQGFGFPQQQFPFAPGFGFARKILSTSR